MRKLGEIPILVFYLARSERAHAPHYAEIVIDHAKRRRLIQLSEEIQRSIYLPGADTHAIQERVRECLATPASAMFTPTVAREFLDNPPELREPLISGLLRRGEVMNIVGAPSRGKAGWWSGWRCHS